MSSLSRARRKNASSKYAAYIPEKAAAAQKLLALQVRRQTFSFFLGLRYTVTGSTHSLNMGHTIGASMQLSSISTFLNPGGRCALPAFAHR